MVDTGSIFFIILKSELMLFYPSAIISPTRQVLKGIAGHLLDLLEQCKIPIVYSDNLIINCDFLVSVFDLSTLRLNTENFI